MIRLKPRPIMFVAEGVPPYFEGVQVISLFLRLCQQFPGCELVCDALTPFGVWADNMHLAYVIVKARMHWSIKQGKDVVDWGEGICLLGEWYYYEGDDSPLQAYRWMRLIPPLAKAAGVFHYRLGIQA